MPKLWKLLAVLLISMFGCNNGFAMQFSQPEEIGFVDTPNYCRNCGHALEWKQAYERGYIVEADE